VSAHNRHLVPMPTKRRARRSKTSAAPVAAAIARSGLKTWHTVAFLIVTAVIWYLLKWPIIVFGTMAAFFIGLFWLCRRFPRTMFVNSIIVNGLLSGRRRR
jgi:hypothetical protein